ncbi:MAG: peptidyl-prolyl cis-trans isomerase [Bacteroidota bacterium]
MKQTFRFALVLLLVIVQMSCDFLLKNKNEKEPLARVGDTYLYKEDVTSLIGKNISSQDSVSFVTNYINTWAAKQLLLSKSKINLPEAQLTDFDRLVADYKADLYSRAYIDALVQQSQDTAISNVQLQQFYEAEKKNFTLNEKLVQLRFVVLPNQFLDKEAVKQRLKNFKEEDKAYLDSIAVQFKKIHFNDSIWVSASNVRAEIPPLNYLDEDSYLKKSQFFEFQDSTELYLGRVNNVLEVNEIAPLSYIGPSIKQVILNRRRLDYVRKLEIEIIDEAIKKEEFEVYENE